MVLNNTWLDCLALQSVSSFNFSHVTEIPLKGLVDVDPKLFPPPPSTRRGLRGHPIQGTPRCEPPPEERVVKYWTKLPASVVTAPSVKRFKKRLEKVWADVFPHLPHWLKSHLPNPLTAPQLHATHLQFPHRYVTQIPVLSMWFLQAGCGLLFTIINLNRIKYNSPSIYLGRLESQRPY